MRFINELFPTPISPKMMKFGGGSSLRFEDITMDVGIQYIDGGLQVGRFNSTVYTA